MADPHMRVPHASPLTPEPPRRVEPDAARTPSPAHLARMRRGKPEPNGVRMALGLAGLASASALATAMLPSILPQPAAGADAAVVEPATPEPSVIVVTRVVQLAPGQTLPPEAAAAGGLASPATTPQPKPTAKPTPRIIYQTVTRQSGKP